MNRFAFTVIYAPDSAKEVLNFYVAAFGLTLKFYDDAADFGELDTGECTIAVANHSAGEFMVGVIYKKSGDGFPKNVELAFYTDDVDLSYNTSVQKGCDGLCPPKAMPWGQTVAFVKSIEGTLIELVSEPQDS